MLTLMSSRTLSRPTPRLSLVISFNFAIIRGLAVRWIRSTVTSDYLPNVKPKKFNSQGDPPFDFSWLTTSFIFSSRKTVIDWSTRYSLSSPKTVDGDIHIAQACAHAERTKRAPYYVMLFLLYSRNKPIHNRVNWTSSAWYCATANVRSMQSNQFFNDVFLRQMSCCNPHFNHCPEYWSLN